MFNVPAGSADYTRPVTSSNDVAESTIFSNIIGGAPVLQLHLIVVGAPESRIIVISIEEVISGSAALSVSELSFDKPIPVILLE